MSGGLKLAFKLGLGFLLSAVILMALVPTGSAEFWVCVITAVADGLFCFGILLFTLLKKRK